MLALFLQINHFWDTVKEERESACTGTTESWCVCFFVHLWAFYKEEEGGCGRETPPLPGSKLSSDISPSTLSEETVINYPCLLLWSLPHPFGETELASQIVVTLMSCLHPGSTRSNIKRKTAKAGSTLFSGSQWETFRRKKETQGASSDGYRGRAEQGRIKRPVSASNPPQEGAGGLVWDGGRRRSWLLCHREHILLPFSSRRRGDASPSAALKTVWHAGHRRKPLERSQPPASCMESGSVYSVWVSESVCVGGCERESGGMCVPIWSCLCL